MGNSSSDRSGGGPGDRYREGGKEARAKILLDTTEDGDPDPKVRFLSSPEFKVVKRKVSTLTVSPDRSGSYSFICFFGCCCCLFLFFLPEF